MNKKTAQEPAQCAALIAPYGGFIAGFRTWTPEEEAAAKQLREDGKTYAQISEVLDRSVASIQACLLRMEGRKPRKKATERHCMCCRNKFSSEGLHHRLCTSCRRKDISPYAP